MGDGVSLPVAHDFDPKEVVDWAQILPDENISPNAFSEHAGVRIANAEAKTDQQLGEGVIPLVASLFQSCALQQAQGLSERSLARDWGCWMLEGFISRSIASFQCGQSSEIAHLVQRLGLLRPPEWLLQPSHWQNRPILGLSLQAAGCLVVEFFFDFDFLFSTIGGWRWLRCWLLALNNWWRLRCWLLRLSQGLTVVCEGLGVGMESVTESGINLMLRSTETLHTGQVGLLPSETFKGRDIAKYPGWSAVLEPNGKLCRFSPQELRKSRLDKEGTDALHQPAVERLCDAVMLRSVVGGEATFSALLLKEFGEGVAGIFAAPIRSQAFDLDPLLSEHPSRIGFISVKSFILGPENGELGKARVIVGKRSIIAPSAQTRDRRGAP
ncbi:hypothetical protein BGY98DRAFT_938914 [Russula aff. rugulosa BPL654]|nr:hypothetical protein BGY98DRAFT_938914 [Russula aff. rugulosa BPL654]